MQCKLAFVPSAGRSAVCKSGSGRGACDIMSSVAVLREARTYVQRDMLSRDGREGRDVPRVRAYGPVVG